jgi:hypothetical protein
LNEQLEPGSGIRRIAFLGDYLPRKCGIATFTSDLLTGVATEYPGCECFAVPVNDVEGGYDYPDVVRFEIEEQDLVYQRAADTSTSGTSTSSACNMNSGSSADPPGATCWRSCASCACPSSPRSTPSSPSRTATSDA